jgi:RHS repeat-associated protein
MKNEIGHGGIDRGLSKLGKVEGVCGTNVFPNKKILEVEKLTLYPNGYININQNGEYTKHYYADAARIASKIGSGYNIPISYNADNTQSENALKIMKNELGVLTGDSVDNITHSLNTINYLTGNGNTEDGLFFYHGNHLSSTQMITDINANISQAVLYTPWGSVIKEYKADWMLDTIPRYLFNAKEKDEESGLYYYEARYYSDEDIVFRARDPKFEEYFWMSPYAYCGNNPVIYIDPTGMEFDPASQEVVANFIAETNNKISTITNEMNTLKQNGGSSSDYYKGLEIQLGELNAAINEINALDADEGTMYSINFTNLPGDVPGTPVSNDAAGNIIYNGTNSRGQNKVTINIRGTEAASRSIQAHEFKHAFQYLEGRLGWYFDASGVLQGTSNNKVFEREAGFRESMYNGTYRYGNTIENYSLGSIYQDLPDFDLFPSSYKGYAKTKDKNWNFITGR